MDRQPPRIDSEVVVSEEWLARWALPTQVVFASVLIAILCLIVFAVIRSRRRKASVT